ncbi:MAG TPA: hypothetical protein VGZ47_09855 [Gemmataceae bacterium]|jgi:hypothetical protein|nr:hypothetical protein [Gemmataceae bacterium]
MFEPIPLTVPTLLAMGVVAVIVLLVEALILRAACDLSSVDPPSFLKAIVLILIYAALATPVGYAIGWFVGRFGTSARFPDEGRLLLAGVLGLLAGGLIASIIYTIALHVRYYKGLLIWFFETCVRALVFAVIGLFAIGVWTIVDGIRRVI